MTSQTHPHMKAECSSCGALHDSRSDLCRACHARARREGTPIAQRFWQNVDTSGGLFACWPWMSYRDPQGYGRISAGGRELNAHRVAWELVNGPMPAGLFACHTCDNPPCCNPSHVYAGTPAMNTADARVRGRLARGERHGSARLTADLVEAIRTASARGEERVALGLKYGVSASTIYDIATRRTWTHVA